MVATISKDFEATLKKNGHVDVPIEIEGTGIDIAELTDAVKYRRDCTHEDKVTLSLNHVEGDVFDDLSDVVYPFLLSHDQYLVMDRDDFIGQLDVVLRMANKSDVFAGIYMYSVQVTEPLDISDYVDKTFIDKFVSREFQVDVQRGYLYHSFLYDMDSVSLKAVLKEVLARANKVQISIRRGPSGTVEERKTIHFPA